MLDNHWGNAYSKQTMYMNVFLGHYFCIRSIMFSLACGAYNVASSWKISDSTINLLFWNMQLPTRGYWILLSISILGVISYIIVYFWYYLYFIISHLALYSRVTWRDRKEHLQLFQPNKQRYQAIGNHTKNICTITYFPWSIPIKLIYVMNLEPFIWVW